MLFKQLSRNHKIKMSSKVNTLCLFIFFLLFFTLASAARPEPAFTDASPMKNLHGEVEAVKVPEVEESCDGLGEEECLMRRTLAAHIDYIYTQKSKP